MRGLTQHQKKLIKKWFNAKRHKEKWECFYTCDLRSVKDLSYEQWKILVDINDTEILYQNINNFLDGLVEAS